MMQVAITTTSFGKYDPEPLILLRKYSAKIKLNSLGRKLTQDEVIDLASDATGIIAGTEDLNAVVLEKLTQLKVISRCGVGIDNVDLDTAKRLGIKVFNTPEGPTLAVAELTVGLILALLRQICQSDREIRAGKWEKRMGNLLRGKDIGIIGFGRIGQLTGSLLMDLGCKVSYCDPQLKECKLKCTRLDLEVLLERSDIVCLHVSGRYEKPLLGNKQLKMMKPGSWLINCARGGVVDEDALYHLLKEGHLSGAALDVFEREPYMGPLAQLDNVIVTPHIGSYAKEARVTMEIQAVKNLLKGLTEY